LGSRPDALLRGELVAARRDLEHAAALGNPDVTPRLLAVSIYDAAAAARSFALAARSVLGLEAGGRRALALAQEQHDPATRRVCLLGAAMAAAVLHDGATLVDASEDLLAISRQYDVPFWRGHALAYQGWALALAGRFEDAVESLRAGLAELRIGAWRPYYLSLLAESCARSGRVVEAQAALDEAMGVLGGSRAYFALAELWRCRAEALLAAPAAGTATRPEAACHLQHAVRIAQRQQAAVFARRAAERLAQLVPPPG